MHQGSGLVWETAPNPRCESAQYCIIGLFVPFSEQCCTFEMHCHADVVVPLYRGRVVLMGMFMRLSLPLSVLVPALTCNRSHFVREALRTTHSLPNKPLSSR
jgi:hypothetical protein